MLILLKIKICLKEYLYDIQSRSLRKTKLTPLDYIKYAGSIKKLLNGDVEAIIECGTNAFWNRKVLELAEKYEKEHKNKKDKK